jgi:hypothetical protein
MYHFIFANVMPDVFALVVFAVAIVTLDMVVEHSSSNGLLVC